MRETLHSRAGHTALDSCEFTLRRQVEQGRLLLENGGPWTELRQMGEQASEVALWSPVPGVGRAAAAYFDLTNEGRPATGQVADPLGLLQQAGELLQLRLLETGVATPCCGSRLAVELEAARLVFRGAVHQPAPGPAAEVAALRPAYPVRAASEWAVCDWNAHLLDPLQAAGVLIVKGSSEKAAPEAAAHSPVPEIYVLWQDVNHVPRGWEAFTELSDPSALTRAFNAEFRYAAREEELLVVDRSIPAPPGPPSPISSEHVTSGPFAAPPLERFIR